MSATIPTTIPTTTAAPARTRSLPRVARILASMVLAICVLAGCPRKESEPKPTGSKGTQAASPGADKPTTAAGTGAEADARPATEDREAGTEDSPKSGTDDDTPDSHTKKTGAPNTAAKEGQQDEDATDGTEPGEETGEKAAEKPAVSLADVTVDCDAICEYQFDCADAALKAAGQPATDARKRTASRKACVMACDTARKSGQPLAMKNYQATMVCLEQPCGKAHMKCLVSLIKE